MKDYYEILQVSPNAEPEVIAAAYRRLARKYHPDAYAGPDATGRMRELNEAYEELGDPARRAEYDRIRSYARSDTRGEERETPTPPPHEQGPEAAKAAEAGPAEPSKRGRMPVVSGLLGLAVLGVGIGIGVWVAVGAGNNDNDTSFGGATGGLPRTPTPAAGSSGLSILSATPRRTAVATPAPTRSEAEGVGLADVWTGAGMASSCWDVGLEDQTQCIVDEAEASGASRAAIAFFLHHGYFLDSLQENGRVDWGLVWHPIGDQTRRHPAFLNGTPPVLLIDDALGSVSDLADDATTYLEGVLGYVEGSPERKLIAWPQYGTLQSVQRGAASTTWAGDVLGQAFVVSMPLKECRACPTERELQVGFIFDESGTYRGRGLWH